LKPAHRPEGGSLRTALDGPLSARHRRIEVISLERLLRRAAVESDSALGVAASLSVLRQEHCLGLSHSL
jgi:hypothetical protein